MKRVAVVAETEQAARDWIASVDGVEHEAEIMSFAQIKAIREWDKEIAVVGKWSQLPEDVQRELGAWDFKHPSLDVWIDKEEAE